MSLRKDVLEEMQRRQDELKGALRDLDEAVDILQSRRDLKKAQYRVEIRSYWVSEGERNYECCGVGLEETIAQAEKGFKDTNKRSDVQGEYHVRVVVGPLEAPVPVPYWSNYTEHARKNQVR